MELCVLGLSHRTAPVEIREKLALSREALEPALQQLLGLPGVQEGLILSTCNRVELVVVVEEASRPDLRGFLATLGGVDQGLLERCTYELSGKDAVRHVFRVASSLDSMVVGEAQILGQVKEAYEVAKRAATLGPLLDRCLTKAFKVAKQVRTETRLAYGSASVSSVAVELAERIFGGLEGRSVLVVGAGAMASLTAQHLKSAGCGRIFCVNRTFERALGLASQVEGTARPWEELDTLLAAVDVVISSTGSEQPFLSKEQVERAMRARRQRSLVLVDIAVPRDIDPAVGEIEEAYLFDIDDLQRVVAETMQERSKEAARAERIVQAQADEFEAWLREKNAVPAIRAIRTRVRDVVLKELERGLGNGSLAVVESGRVEMVAEAITSKLLHPAFVALKEEAGRGKQELLRAATKLFGIEGEHKE